MEWFEGGSAEFFSQNFMWKFSDKHPHCSPDLNPIENAFGAADDAVAKQSAADAPKTQKDAIENFQAVFGGLAASGFLGSLPRSMLERMKDVLDAHGGPTRW